MTFASEVAFVLTSRAGSMALGDVPRIVGILNVTPDSFYDGGRYASEGAVQRAVDMIEEGADWVDVGGMSTRPGSEEIPVEEELRRVRPVISSIRAARPSAWISIDTYRASVAEAAIEAGAACINEVSGFSLDPASLPFAASARCPVIINHMKGRPRHMQDAPAYQDLWADLLRFFEEKLEGFVRAGGDESFTVLDPGIGFGKTVEHNVEILRGLSNLRALGRPVMVGCSRKSFIERITGAPVNRRLPGSLAAAGWAALQGAHLVRVHDVAETVQFLRIFSEFQRHA